MARKVVTFSDDRNLRLMNIKKLQIYPILPISGLLCGSATAELLITQYYEGPTGNNKYIELTNTATEPLDISDFTVTSWSNAATESWKTVGSFPNNERALSGTLAAGETLLIANPQAEIPLLAGAADLTSDVTFINGDDSVVLYQGVGIDPANIVDALSFTDDGSEGKDISLVRKNTEVGFNLDLGSTVLDFPDVWGQVSTDDVGIAILGEDSYLGSSDLGVMSPLVRFTASNAAVGEQDGTIDLELEIRLPDGNEVSVDIELNTNDSSATTADIGSYVTETVTFPAGATDGDTQMITVTLTDDTEKETSELAIFALTNLTTTGDALLKGATSFNLSLQDNDTEIPPIYISEIADPQDNANDQNGRFVEFFNPTSEELDLAEGNWNLVYYVNGNSSGTSIPLSGIIPANGTFVFASSSSGFMESYPAASPSEQQNGTVNSNGDDNIELRFGGGQGVGALVDVYGMPGTDGTGELWDFENSRVDRIVGAPNATFTIEEWTITPAVFADMTPGVHGGGGPIGGTELEVVDFNIDIELGSGTLTATGLGTKIWVIQFSDDLGFGDAWEEIASGFTETDNPDGSVNLLFFDSFGSVPERFYRLIEQR